MSSPTESAKFTETVDFSKYGLAWEIDDETNKLPDSFFNNISKVTGNNTSITFHKPNGESIELNTLDFLGEGSYGKTYSTDYKIDGVNTVLKIINTTTTLNSDYKKKVYDTMQEVLVQILIYEATKNLNFPEIGLQGPFCPHFFCLGKSENNIYILMEQLDKELLSLVKNKKSVSTWSLASAKIIKETTLQIAKILGILYNKFNFNHRDFKPDNIMYKMIDNKLNVRLIDFGFSCLTYKNLKLKSIGRDTFSSRLQHCESRTRDLHSYFFYLLNYTDYKQITDCPVKRIINVLCSTDNGKLTNWANTYMQYNESEANNSPIKLQNVDFDVVYNVFNELELTKPNNSCSPVNQSWAKYLKMIHTDTLNYLKEGEFEYVSEAARKPLLSNYLSQKTEILWSYNKDPNALITSFKYRLVMPNNSIGSIEYDLPAELLPLFFKNHAAENIDAVDLLGETILHKIARNPNVSDSKEKLDYALQANSNIWIVNRQNRDRKTPLDIALETNFTYALQTLPNAFGLLVDSTKLHIVEKIFDKNPEAALGLKSMSTNENILHLIASSEKDESSLLDKILAHPDSTPLFNQTEKKGLSPMDYMIKTNNIKAIEKCLGIAAKVKTKTFLFSLSIITEPQVLDKLVAKYFDSKFLDSQNTEGMSPLIYATTQNNIYLVKKLIELGAKTALKDDLGKTALHYASVNASNHEPNAFEIVKLLIDANPALPNIKNTDKKGPGNPNYAVNSEVRNYIRTRKTGWFTKRKVNTNKAKQAAGTRRRTRNKY